MADFNYSIPTLSGEKMALSLKSGTTAVLVGANGSGKSRLGAYLDLRPSYQKSTHRISAQRALQIPHAVAVTNLERAEHMLWYGSTRESDKATSRWHKKPATLLLNDYDHLLIALFSDWMKVAADHERERKANPHANWPPTKIALVKEIWDDTIRTRALFYDGASLHVSYPGQDEAAYPADEMSDGERVLVYLAGQCLHAPPDGVIIIDEPELHIHKAILPRFWDVIESARSDCLFIYLTHDLDFAISRTGARKFAVLRYDRGRWDIIEIPEGTGLPEDITVLILGSRKPILFIEGELSSLDASIFGKVYDSFTIVPVGSREEVIHLTNSYNAKRELHHWQCYGLIDRDGRMDEEVKYLKERNIYTIKYAEVENLLLVESVMTETARLLAFSEEEAAHRTEQAKRRIFELAAQGSDGASIEYAKRRLARALSTIGFEKDRIEDLAAEVEAGLKALDVVKLYEKRKSEIGDALERRDYEKVLEFCDHKGMIRQIGKYFDLPANGYVSYVTRQLGSERGGRILDILQTLMPDLQSS